MYTRYQKQCFCLHGSMHILQRSINGASGLSERQKGRQTGGPPELLGKLVFPGKEAGYSAACFRGGSSAPESWISAT